MRGHFLLTIFFIIVFVFSSLPRLGSATGSLPPKLAGSLSSGLRERGPVPSIANDDRKPESVFRYDKVKAESVAGQDSERALEESEILFRNSPWPLSLLPHEPLSVVADVRKNGVFSFVGPHYHDGWRFQFMSQKRGKTGTGIVLEFANTGNRSIVLTNDNLELFIPHSPASKVGSSLQNSPLTLQPGEVKTLNIVSPNPSASGLRIHIGDYSQTARFERFEDPIINTRPFFAPRELIGPAEQPISRKTMEVTGNGKFKYQPMGIQYTSNKALGKLLQPENGMLLLLKVRLANTSVESMHIYHFTIGSRNSNANKPSLEYVFTPEELRISLKEWALPTEIPAQTIVEGYIPFLFQDTNKYLYILAESNLGNFEFRNMDSFLPLSSGSF